MVCSNCGAPCPDDAASCNQCGNNVNPISVVPQAPPALKHSGLGIVSTIIAGFVVVLFMAMIILSILRVIYPHLRHPDSPLFVIYVLLTMLAALMMLVGLILGIIGWAQKNRRKMYAIIGTIANAIFTLGFITLVIWGNLAK